MSTYLDSLLCIEYGFYLALGQDPNLLLAAAFYEYFGSVDVLILLVGIDEASEYIIDTIQKDRLIICCTSLFLLVLL